MNNILALLLVAGLLLGCTKDSSITFSSEIFTETALAICKQDPCSEITIEYVVANGDSAVVDSINTKISAFIIESLFLGEDDYPATNTIEDAAKQFILAYRDHQADIPTELDSGGYVADISVTILSQSPSLISFELVQYKYTGGVHGYGSTHFLNIHPESGDELNIQDLVTDLDAFTIFMEKQFKKEHQISEEENINSTGFWFDEDRFYLPETMGFTKDSLILIYNPYDIAPYGNGSTELRIPTAKVQPFLANEFL